MTCFPESPPFCQIRRSYAFLSGIQSSNKHYTPSVRTLSISALCHFLSVLIKNKRKQSRCRAGRCVSPPFGLFCVLCAGWPSAEEARRGMLLRSFRTVLHGLIRAEPEDGSCFEKFFPQTQIVQPDFFFPLFTGRRKLWYDKAGEDQVRPGFRAGPVDAKEKDHDQAVRYRDLSGERDGHL